MVLTEEKAIACWMDYLTGELDTESENDLFQFLSLNKKLAMELKADQVLWNTMKKIESPLPDKSMDQRFEAMLHGYIAANQRNTAINWWPLLQEWFTRGWQVGLASLSIGILVGWYLLPSGNQKSELSMLTNEVAEMKKVMMFTLIEQPQAQDRIRAVSLVNELPNADRQVIEVLAKTLNTDANINVRLAALESIARYWEDPYARAELVKSITLQDSPLIQNAIADAMLALREKSSITEFNKLLDKPELNTGVKLKLESTIEKLNSI